MVIRCENCYKVFFLSFSFVVEFISEKVPTLDCPSKQRDVWRWIRCCWSVWCPRCVWAASTACLRVACLSRHAVAYHLRSPGVVWTELNRIEVGFWKSKRKPKRLLTCKLEWQPSSSSDLTTESCPLLTAICSGVCPRQFRGFRSAPAAASSSITALWSPNAAWCTARSPSLSSVWQRERERMINKEFKGRVQKKEFK